MSHVAFHLETKENGVWGSHYACFPLGWFATKEQNMTLNNERWSASYGKSNTKCVGLYIWWGGVLVEGVSACGNWGRTRWSLSSLSTHSMILRVYFRGMIPRASIRVLLGVSQAYALHICIYMFMHTKIWFLFIYVFTIQAICLSSCTGGMFLSAETSNLLVCRGRCKFWGKFTLLSCACSCRSLDLTLALVFLLFHLSSAAAFWHLVAFLESRAARVLCQVKI